MPENTPSESDPWAEATDAVPTHRDEPASTSQGHGSHAGHETHDGHDGPAATPDPVAEQVRAEAERRQREAAESAEQAQSATGDAIRAAEHAAGPHGNGEYPTTEPPAASTPPTPMPEGDDPVRRILADVAAGRLGPEEAAARLDEVRRTADAGSAPSGSGATSAGAKASGGPGAGTSEQRTLPTTSAAEPTSRVRVRAVGRRVRIIGEPFVSTVAVDGPHVVRQEGDTLVVTSEGEFGASLDGFTLMRTRSLRDVQERVFDLGRELSVRVNPSLAVEVEVTAGSVNAERIPSLEQVRVTGGSARVRDVEGPIDVLVQAGSAQVEGRIHRGKSRLRAESGSLQLRLLPGSSVRVRPDVQLGRVQWEPPGADRDEHVIGSGDGQLDLEVVMGMATVKQAP
ncbi:hypothetical protein ACWDWO_10395 [Actinopolymorpha singaporensis]